MSEKAEIERLMQLDKDTVKVLRGVQAQLAEKEKEIEKLKGMEGYSLHLCDKFASLQKKHDEAVRAMEQALSDFKWAESVDKRTNFQSSIILLKAALPKEKR